LVRLVGGEVQAKGFEELPKARLIKHGGIVEYPPLGRKLRTACFTWNIRTGEEAYRHARPYGRRNFA
jgi:hypothetical protein